MDSPTFFPSLPSPLLKIDWQPAIAAGVEVWIKRDDLIHPHISGNKWRKLKHNLTAFRQSGKARLLTFGGAYSNHLYATAAAGKLYGIPTIGIVRGERVEPLNTTLSFCEAAGMELHFISREAYRKKDSPDFLFQLNHQFKNCFFLPEGGANHLAVRGCMEIVEELPFVPDYIALASGTGATAAGIISAVNPKTKVVAVSALKGGDFLRDDIFTMARLEQPSIATADFHLFTEYHHGGYAKTNPDLNAFIKTFEEETAILIEPVYTGKLFWAINEELKKGFFTKNTTLVVIHTGGLRV